MSIDMSKHLKREPQIYKGVELYPLLLSDIEMYETFIEIMCIPKEYVPIREVLKMSYLKYLVFFMQGFYDIGGTDGLKKISFKDKLEKLLKHITHKEVSIEQVIDGILEGDIQFHYDVYIGENKFREYDFDNIREIILEQNGKSLSFIESFNPELERSLQVFNNNKNGVTFTNRIFIYSAISCTDIAEMLNWTITEFEKKEEILKIYEEWKIYRPLEASGQIEVKPPNIIRNPFDYEDRVQDRYASILIDADDFAKDLKQFSK